MLLFLAFEQKTKNLMKYLLILLISTIFLKPLIAQQNFEWAFTTNQYDRCNDFSDGLAIVKVGFERGYITREGKIHIQPKFNIIDAYSEDVAKEGKRLYGNFKSIGL